MKNVDVFLLVFAAACTTTSDPAKPSTDPASTEPGANGGGVHDPSGVAPAPASTATDGGADASVPCAAGQGRDPSGKCVACNKTCGANGACVVGWEGGAHCKCDAGFYESLSGCAPSAGTACEKITCAGHGTCFSGPPLFSAECHCEGDYVSWGASCAAMHAIRCIDTDGTLKDKGTIRCNGNAFEVCRDADGDGTVEWAQSGTPTCGKTCNECLSAKCDNGDGTGGQACPTGTVCMGKVHETDVYACVASCDCSNCGTCDPGQFNGYQRACGSNDDSFANPTKVCKSPCPHAGDGCLPYGQFSFCFPNEGCASAAP